MEKMLYKALAMHDFSTDLCTLHTHMDTQIVAMIYLKCTYLNDTIDGVLHKQDISPKKSPSIKVSYTVSPSSDTASTVPLVMKCIYGQNFA